MNRDEILRNLLTTFQSRNRDAFDFKLPATAASAGCLTTFQSRNRDAFDFKADHYMPEIHEQLGFNLVIEMLLISSSIGGTGTGTISSLVSIS